eukprot:scaffold10210_cov199-Chaetoceros_neogracile.AAC.5
MFNPPSMSDSNVQFHTKRLLHYMDRTDESREAICRVAPPRPTLVFPTIVVLEDHDSSSSDGSIVSKHTTTSRRTWKNTRTTASCKQRYLLSEWKNGKSYRNALSDDYYRHSNELLAPYLKNRSSKKRSKGGNINSTSTPANRTPIPLTHLFEELSEEDTSTVTQITKGSKRARFESTTGLESNHIMDISVKSGRSSSAGARNGKQLLLQAHKYGESVHRTQARIGDTNVAKVSIGSDAEQMKEGMNTYSHFLDDDFAIFSNQFDKDLLQSLHF